jgi:hypothetical protein
MNGVDGRSPARGLDAAHRVAHACHGVTPIRQCIAMEAAHQ